MPPLALPAFDGATLPPPRDAHRVNAPLQADTTTTDSTDKGI